MSYGSERIVADMSYGSERGSETDHMKSVETMAELEAIGGAVGEMACVSNHSTIILAMLLILLIL